LQPIPADWESAFDHSAISPYRFPYCSNTGIASFDSPGSGAISISANLVKVTLL
jgi:hypothetical protein